MKRVLSLLVGFAIGLSSLPSFGDQCQILFSNDKALVSGARYYPVDVAARFEEVYPGHRRDSLVFSVGPDGRMIAKSVKGNYDQEDRLNAPPGFKSIRNIVNQNSPGLAGSSWNSDRKMELIPLYINEGARDLKTADAWQGLPPDLQKLFGSGKFLSTVNLSGREQHLWDAEYAVLMASAVDLGGYGLGGGFTAPVVNGRTGVLMRKVKYGFVPILVHDEVTGQDNLVEYKGGGPPDEKYESSRIHGVRGGLLPSFADNEFRNLEHIAPKVDPRGAQALGHFRFNNPLLGNIEQAILLRLSPSNQRLSYREEPTFLRVQSSNTSIDGQELDRRASHFLGEIVASLFANGIVLASHPENILVNADLNEFHLTDYSDMFSIDEFPRILEGKTLSAEFMIRWNIRIVAQLPSYGESTESEYFSIFRSGFSERAAILGLAPELVAKINETQDLDALSQLIFQQKIFKFSK